MGEGCCGAEGMCLLNVVDATVKGMGRGLAGQILPEALLRPPRCAPMHDRPCHTGSSELLRYPLPWAERLLSPALAQGDGGNGPPAPEAGGVAAGGGGGAKPRRREEPARRPWPIARSGGRTAALRVCRLAFVIMSEDR